MCCDMQRVMVHDSLTGSKVPREKKGCNARPGKWAQGLRSAKIFCSQVSDIRFRATALNRMLTNITGIRA